jgi:hypothetical protein
MNTGTAKPPIEDGRQLKQLSSGSETAKKVGFLIQEC